MAEIKTYNRNCNKCIHEPVCEYIDIRRDLIDKVNTTIDNHPHPSFFEIFFECRHFQEKISTSRSGGVQF